MAKTPPKKKSPKIPVPEPAQIKAVERLIEARNYPKAIERVRSLVERFPDYGGTWRLLIDALALGKGSSAAALAAYQWAQRRPNSLPAQETLLSLTVEGGYLFLADRISARVRDLGATTPGFPLNAATLGEMLRQLDGSQATLGEMERFDIGKLHLDGQDFAGAVRELEGIANTSARNNRALSLFHLGRIDEASGAFMDAWQADPDNLFALDWALRLRLWRDDEVGARGLAVPLGQAQARRVEDAQAQLMALLLIQENQAAWDAFERSGGTDWARDESGMLGALRLHLGACASSRLGRGDRARALWRQALGLYPGLASAQAGLSALDQEGAPSTYPESFDQGQIFPQAWVNALREGGEDEFNDRLDALTASNAYLEAVYLGGDSVVRKLASMLLTHRLKAEPDVGQGRRGAMAILRDLAKLPIGTPQERFGFLTALRKAGLIAPDEAMQFWDGTELREVQVLDTEIVREPEPSDLPDDLQPLLEKFLLLYRKRHIDEAEAALDAILARVPDHQVAMGNLAAIRVAQGRGREAREVLRRVVAVHPDYLFARCNLAGMLIEDGELDEAQDLLAGLAQRPRLHIQEFYALYGVMAMLNRARGQDKAADDFIAALEQVTEDEDDERLLAQAKARVARATAEGRFKSAMRKLLGAPRSS